MKSYIIILVLILLALSALSGYIFMLLWNWLMPLLWANAPVLTFFQSWGLLFLISIIANMFKSHKD